MQFVPCRLIVIVGLLAGLAVLPARAENWPHWRGPAWNGSTTETNLPDRWSATENIVWIAPLPGRSGATPVIWEESVFLPSPDADGNLLLLCVDSKSGAFRWRKTVAKGNTVSGKNNMASPSAVTDGKRVVVIFGTGVVAAYDFAGGELWSRNLAKQYGKFALMWLYGSSPLLYRDKLYIEVLQRDDPAAYRHSVDEKPTRESFLLCLDPQTGRELWRRIRKTDAKEESHDAYTSPIVYQSPRGTEILLFGADYLTGHDPDSGVELWRSGSLNAKNSTVWRTIASPVAGPEGVFACLPRTFNPTVAVSPGRPDRSSPSMVAWRNSNASSDVPSPLYYQGKLFVLNGNRQTMTCVDPQSGATKWSGRLDSDETFSASPTGADGKIYCISEGGTVVVLSAGEKFKIVSHSVMEGAAEGGPVLSSIAVANGRLFVRTAQRLYCVGPK